MENDPNVRPPKAVRRAKYVAVLAALLAALAAAGVLPESLAGPLAEVGGFVLGSV